MRVLLVAAVITMVCMVTPADGNCYATVANDATVTSANGIYELTAGNSDCLMYMESVPARGVSLFFAPVTSGNHENERKIKRISDDKEILKWKHQYQPYWTAVTVDVGNIELKLKQTTGSTIPMSIYWHFIEGALVSSISPNRWGAGGKPTLTVGWHSANDDPVYSVEWQFLQIAFVSTGGACPSGSEPSYAGKVMLPSSTEPLSELIDSAGTYDVCISRDGGKVFFKESATVTVVGLPAADTLGATLNTVSAGATTQSAGLPTLWDYRSATSVIGWTPAGGSCAATTLGRTEIGVSASSPVTLDAPITIPGDYRLCVSVDGGLTWSYQSYVRLTVTPVPVASASSITSVSASVFGYGTYIGMTLSGELGSSSKIRLLLSSDTDCATQGIGEAFISGTWYGTGAYPAAGTYSLCFQLGGTSTWVEQTMPGVEVTVNAEPTATSITSITPSTVGEGQTGIEIVLLPSWALKPASNTFVMFTLGSCASYDVGSSYDEGESVTLWGSFTTPGEYSVCITNNWNTWYLQSSPTLTVVAKDGISGVSPAYVSENEQETLSFSGTQLVGFKDALGVALDTVSCTSPFDMTMALVTSTAATMPTGLAAGTYKVCQTVDGGSTYHDTSVELTVVALTTTLVSSATASQGIAGYANRVAFVFATEMPGTSLIGVTLEATCSNMETGAVEDGALTASIDVPAGLAAGTWHACVRMNGVWEMQSSGADFVVYPRETADSLISVNATAIVENRMTPLLFTASAGALTPTSVVALAVSGQCGVSSLHLASAPLTNAGSTAVSMSVSIPATFGANVVLATCFSADGTSFVEQSAAATQPVGIVQRATVVTAILPGVLANNSVPTIDVSTTLGGAAPITPIGNLVQVGLGPAGECTTGSMLVSTVLTTPTLQSFGANLITTLPAVSLCYSVDAGATWTTQVAVGRIEVTTDALGGTVTGISPAVVGADVGFTLALATDGSFAGGEGLALAPPGLCAVPSSHIASATINSTGHATFAAIATPLDAYAVCYSPTGTIPWSLQINFGVAVRVFKATGGSVTAVTPGVLGRGTTPTLTLAGAVGSQTTRAALAPKGGGCSGARIYESSLTAVGASTWALPTIGAPQLGAYEVCLTSDGGATWHVQSSAPDVTVIQATGTSVTRVVPAVIGAGTSPPVTWTGTVASVSTRIALATTGGCGGAKVWESAVADASNATLSVSGLPASDTTLDVCYTVDGGATWETQGVTLEVVVADAGVLHALTPSLVGVSTSPALWLNATKRLPPTAQIAWATTSACDAASRVVLVSLDAVEGATGTGAVFEVAISSPLTLPFSMTLEACLQVGDGTWVAQTDPSTRLSVVVPTATSLSRVSPTSVGVATLAPPQLELTGVAPTAGAWIGLSTTGCGSVVGAAPFNETHVDASAQTGTTTANTTVTLSAALSLPGPHVVCYRVAAGEPWRQQAGLVVHGVGAFATSVTSVSPSVVGVNTAVTLTEILPWPARIPEVRLGLRASADVACENAGVTIVATVAGFDAVAPGTPMPLSGTLSSPGEYVVCFSSNAGASWVEQSVTVNAVQASTGTVTVIAPRVMGVNATSVALTKVAGPALVPLQSGAYLAFVRDTGTCGSAAARVLTLNYNTTTPRTSGATPLVTRPGNYYVCFSLDDGATWYQQANSSVRIEWIEAQGNDVQGVSPSFIGEGSAPATSLTLNGGPSRLTPTSVLAFAPHGAGCTPGTVQAVTPLTGVSAQALGGGGVSGLGAFDVCYSVDGGASYANQTQVSLQVLRASNMSVSGLSPTMVERGAPFALDLTLEGGYTPTTKVAFLHASEVGGGCVAANLVGETSYGPAGAEGQNGGIATSGLYHVCYSVNDGITWVLQETPGLELVVQDCASQSSCGSCVATGVCTWFIDRQLCWTNASLPVANPEDAVNSLDGDTCPTLASATSVSGATQGGTLVPLASSYLYLGGNLGDYSCQWLLNTVEIQGPAVVDSANQVTCESPPALPGILLAQISLVYAGEPYSPDSVTFFYYDCGTGTSCTSCWSASRPDCGWCVNTAECTVGSACAGGQLFAADGACPSITQVSPEGGNYRGGNVVTVNGTLFVEDGSLECLFGTAGSGGNGSTTWISETSVQCVAPPSEANTVVDLSLRLRGLPYTENSVSYLYQADAAITKAPSSPVSGTMMFVIIGGVALVVCVLVALVALLAVRRKQRQLYAPPKLTDAVRHRLIFGDVPVARGDAASLSGSQLGPFRDLLLVPSNTFLEALAKATQATEADRVAKALVWCYEDAGRTLDLFRFFIDVELQMAQSENTMFRTNSFATKMFKTYSKMKGLDYLHATLGYELNRILHTMSSVNIKDQDENAAALAKFTLLRNCQKLFNAIRQSYQEVPLSFKIIFSYLQKNIAERFPIRMEDLASVVSDSLHEHMDETERIYRDGATVFEGVAEYRESITDDLTTLTQVVGPMRTRLHEFEAKIFDFNATIEQMVKAMDDLHGALDPDSPAARRLVEEHSKSQKTIAVGGFFFLRFLVPAITAPESAALLHDLPDPSERKTLVMLAKVIQNLSNNQRFGGKEKHMVKLNDFIETNSGAVQEFFDHLTDEEFIANAGGETGVDPTRIPPTHLEWAIIELYVHARRNLQKSLDVLTGWTAERIVREEGAGGRRRATTLSVCGTASFAGDDLRAAAQAAVVQKRATEFAGMVFHVFDQIEQALGKGPLTDVVLRSPGDGPHGAGVADGQGGAGVAGGQGGAGVAGVAGGAAAGVGGPPLPPPIAAAPVPAAPVPAAPTGPPPPSSSSGSSSSSMESHVGVGDAVPLVEL